MSQIVNATTRVRFVKRDGADREVEATLPLDASVLDNTSSPVYVLNAPEQATQNDRKVYWLSKAGKPVLFSGKADELLEMQVYDTAAIATTDQPDGTDLLIPGKLHIRQGDGRILSVDHTLYVSDRITRTGVNPHTRGHVDGTATVANAWSTYMRFAFRPGTAFEPMGVLRGSVHNSA